MQPVRKELQPLLEVLANAVFEAIKRGEYDEVRLPENVAADKPQPVEHRAS